MTYKPERLTYRAVGIDGTLTAHARLVEFFVEWRDGVILLANLREGKERLVSLAEFEDHVESGFATRLAEATGVSRDDNGLLLDAEIVDILGRSTSNPLDDFERRTRTEDANPIVIGNIDSLDALGGRLAGALADETQLEIVSELERQIHSRDSSWDKVERWASYALHCGAASIELQYRPLLLRCWILRQKLQSTQIRNLYQSFLGELVSWEEFQAELDLLHRTLQAGVEGRLWREHVGEVVKIRQERLRAEAEEIGEQLQRPFDRDPMAGGHPRESSPTLH